MRFKRMLSLMVALALLLPAAWAWAGQVEYYDAKIVRVGGWICDDCQLQVEMRRADGQPWPTIDGSDGASAKWFKITPNATNSLKIETMWRMLAQAMREQIVVQIGLLADDPVTNQRPELRCVYFK